MAISIGEIEAVLRLRDELTPALRVAGNNLQSIGKQLNTFGSSVREAGSSLLPLSLAVAGAGAAIVKFGSDFESTTAKIISISGVSADVMAGFSDQVLELSGRMGVGPNSLNASLLQITSTGIRGAQAMEILEAAARGSAVGLGETVDISRAVTSAVTAWKDQGLTAARATEILFKAVREGGAEANTLAGELGRVVGISAQVGVSFEEVGGFVATFTRLGISSAEAVTALRGVMTSIMDPSKQAKDAFKDLGMTVQDLRDKIAKEGLTAALVDLVSKTKDNDEAIAAIFGNVRALAGVLGTAGAQAQEMANIEKILKNETNDLDAAFDRVQKTLKFKMGQAWADLERAAVNAFMALRPQIDAAVEKLQGFAKWLVDASKKLEDMSPAGKNALLYFTASLAVLAPLLIAAGTGIKLLAFSFSGLGLVSKGAASVLTTLKGVAMYLAGAEFSGAFLGTSKLLLPLRYLLDSVSAFGVKAGTQVAAVRGWGLAVEFAGKAVGIALSPFSLLAGALMSIMGALRWVTGSWDFFLGPLNDVKDALSDTWLVLSRDLKPMFESIAGTVKGVLSGSFAAFLDMLEKIRVKLALVYELWKALQSVGFKMVFGDIQKEADQIRSWDEQIKKLKELAAASREAGNGMQFMMSSHGPENKPKPKGGGGGGGTLADEIKELADQMTGRALAKEVADLEKAFRSLSPAEKEAALESKFMKEKLSDLYKEGAKLPQMFQDVADKVTEAKRRWEALGLVWKALKDADKDAAKTAEEIVARQVKVTEDIAAARGKAFDDALRTAGEIADDINKIEMSKTDYAIEQARRQYAETMRNIEPLRKSVPEIYAVAAAGAKKRLDQMVADAKMAAEGVVGWFTKAMADLPSVILGAVQGGGNVGLAIATSLGSALFSAGSGLNNLLNEGLSSLATKVGGSFAANLASGISAALPAIGSLLGPVLAKLGGKLMGFLGFGTAGRDMVKDFAASMGGFDALHDKLLSALDPTMAENLWKSLTQGVGRNNPEAAKRAIDDITRALAAAEQKTKDIRDEMARLSKETGVASAALREFMAANGGDRDVQEFVLGQVKTAGTAVGQMMEAMERAAKAGALAPITAEIKAVQAAIEAAKAAGASDSEIDALQAKLEALEKQAENVKGEFVLTGEGAKAMASILLAAWDGSAQGLRDMAQDIERLRLAMERSGVTGSAAFTRLTAMAKLASDEITGPMVEAINYGTQALVAMYNSGFLTQETFTGMVGEIMKQRDALLATGATSETVNGVMRGDLQKLWELWKDGKFEIDESTRAVLENAEAQGLIGEKFRSATDKMVAALERLVEIFETVFGKEMVEAARKGAQTVQEIIDGIDATIEVEVNVKNKGGIGGGNQEYGGGTGGGTGGSAYASRFVQPTLFVGAADSDIMASARGMGSDRPIFITVVSELDGKVVAKNQAKHLPAELDFIGARRS